MGAIKVHLGTHRMLISRSSSSTKILSQFISVFASAHVCRAALVKFVQVKKRFKFQFEERLVDIISKNQVPVQNRC